MEAMIERIEEMEEELLARSFLYEHPAAFREGVEAAMEAARVVLAKLQNAVA